MIFSRKSLETTNQTVIVPGVVEVFLSYCPSDDPLDLQLVFACHKGDLSTLERLLKAPRDPIVTFDTLGKLGAMILKGAKRGESGDIMVSMYIYYIYICI